MDPIREEHNKGGVLSIDAGKITEEKAQELIDDFVIKLRMSRQLRTRAYDELSSGDPLWVTEAIGEMTLDGRPLVAKNSYRFLHTFRNLGDDGIARDFKIEGDYRRCE